MTSVAVAWFPPSALREAVDAWPGLFEDWERVPDVVDYCRKIEADLRRIKAGGAEELFVSPIDIDAYRAWCRETGVDEGDAGSRANYAAVIAQRGRAIPWPPRRNAECWCQSAQKYKWCCGRA